MQRFEAGEGVGNVNIGEKWILVRRNSNCKNSGGGMPVHREIERRPVLVIVVAKTRQR